MKNLYHVCITAHNEVLGRNPDDMRAFTNLMALSSYHSDTQIVADSLMSNHAHFVVMSDKPEYFALLLRLSLTKHFNHAHSRTGRLLDKKVFVSKLEGTKHTQMAINYVLRNGLHHGQSETAFAYPYSSCNSLFMTARGLELPKLITDRAEIRTYFPKNAVIPDSLAVDSQGFAARGTFEELRMAESWYGTPNSYIYNMNRRTTEEWINEQKSDEVQTDPVTLTVIENGVNADSEADMLKNEGGGRTSVYNKTDMAVCMLVDNEMLCRYHTDSIYRLSAEIRREIAVELIEDCRVGAVQAARCATVPVQCLPPVYLQKVRKKRQ